MNRSLLATAALLLGAGLSHAQVANSPATAPGTGPGGVPQGSGAPIGQPSQPWSATGSATGSGTGSGTGLGTGTGSASATPGQVSQPPTSQLGSGRSGEAGGVQAQAPAYPPGLPPAANPEAPNPQRGGVRGQQTRPDLSASELSALSAERRAELQARMRVGGQTRQEILETMLLNSLQASHEATRITAMDYRAGNVSFETRSGPRSARFDRSTLNVLN